MYIYIRSGYLPNIAIIALNLSQFTEHIVGLFLRDFTRFSAVGGVRRLWHALSTIYLPEASYVRL